MALRRHADLFIRKLAVWPFTECRVLRTVPAVEFQGRASIHLRRILMQPFSPCLILQNEGTMECNSPSFKSELMRFCKLSGAGFS